jgi:hypothetical protein
VAIGANIFASADLGTDDTSPAGDMYGPAPEGGGGRHPLHPASGFGLGFWFGVGGVVALVLIRRSLPG